MREQASPSEPQARNPACKTASLKRAAPVRSSSFTSLISPDDLLPSASQNRKSTNHQQRQDVRFEGQGNIIEVHLTTSDGDGTFVDYQRAELRMHLPKQPKQN